MTKSHRATHRSPRGPRPAAVNSHAVLGHLETENELITAALLHTQEQLEETTIKLQQKSEIISKLTAKLQKLYSKFPNYWETDAISYSIVKKKGTNKAARLEIIGAQLAGRYHPKLDLELTYFGEITEISIGNSSQGFDYFNWNPTQQELKCHPISGPYSSYNNKIISSIGSTDWKAINELVEKLHIHLIDQPPSSVPTDFVTDLVKGLSNLRHVLARWPSVLRCDSVEITNYLRTSEYQGIDIVLCNASLNGKFFQKLPYRISSVNEQGKTFGQHPRLEFHRDSAHCFDSWYGESNDDRGERLELRFAAPNEMDIKVWNNLSKDDQLLIAANILKLPEIFSTLKILSLTKFQLDPWHALSITLREILTSKMRPTPKTKRN
ncbi:hypothetical protein QEM35_004713 [Pseudomonas putida]|nr:hypothetical protein [Pseudomonas putida]EKT4515526.1 hypothetical protein [Pseudomonas putida]